VKPEVKSEGEVKSEVKTETKPETDVNGSTYYEVDTSSFFIYYNGTWYEQE
jgi:hypothetical protein